MAAVKEDNHTHAADDIDWHASLIDSLCHRQFMNNHLKILNCCHGTVASQIGQPVEPYSLCSVEIPLLTLSVNNDGGKLQ